jgi:hypothetical protein
MLSFNQANFITFFQVHRIGGTLVKKLCFRRIRVWARPSAFKWKIWKNINLSFLSTNRKTSTWGNSRKWKNTKLVWNFLILNHFQSKLVYFSAVVFNHILCVAANVATKAVLLPLCIANYKKFIANLFLNNCLSPHVANGNKVHTTALVLSS